MCALHTQYSPTSYGFGMNMRFIPPIPAELVRNQSTIETALQLLTHLAGAKDGTGSFVMMNTLNSAKKAYAEANEPDVEDLIDRLADAWAWLESQSLLGPDHYQTHTSGWRRITSSGHETVAAESTEKLVAESRLAMQLHPDLESKVRSNFTGGDYETATFAAMKAVEVRIRALSGADADTIGVNLMTHAFKPAGGTLVDGSLEGGEQVALMNLFQGAIGLFKNPVSHRSVNYEDPTEAAEVVLLADLLMRLLDRVETSLAR